jgi:hypothetical protein
MDGINNVHTVTGVFIQVIIMKFAHKSGIVWKIYLIINKLYICNANYPIIMFWIASMPPWGLRLPLISV